MPGCRAGLKGIGLQTVDIVCEVVHSFLIENAPMKNVSKESNMRRYFKRFGLKYRFSSRT